MIQASGMAMFSAFGPYPPALGQFAAAAAQSLTILAFPSAHGPTPTP
jgi:hypothetical protein